MLGTAELQHQANVIKWKLQKLHKLEVQEHKTKKGLWGA